MMVVMGGKKRKKIMNYKTFTHIPALLLAVQTQWHAVLIPALFQPSAVPALALAHVRARVHLDVCLSTAANDPR